MSARLRILADAPRPTPSAQGAIHAVGRRLERMTQTPAAAGSARISAKAERFTESVIREMNRLAIAHGAVSLAQGFPDFPAPAELKQAAADAIFADVNQYAITWGAKPLREAIAAKTARTYPGW